MSEAEVSSPGPDERSLAMLAHALQIVGGFLAPLIIFLIRRESRFVGFHALQALFLQLVYLCAWLILFGALFAGMFVFIARESSRERRTADHKATTEESQPQKPSKEKSEQGTSSEQSAPRQGAGDDKQDQRKSEPPPLWLILSFFLLWGFHMMVWLVMFIVAIVYSVKAGRGEWAAYPIVGRWARRILV